MFLFTLPQLPAASGSSYAVIDAETGRLLLGSSPHTQYPIASLTKIWTAFVTTEEVNISDKTVISSFAATQEGSSIYLKAGEIKSVETLLNGLMLRSGNDAAVALAEHVGGSVEGFVNLMNEKAERAGLLHTSFRNPSGLHHEKHLSTAYDTAIMLKLAMDNKELKQIMSSPSYQKEGVSWGNKHKLVGTNSLAIAGKTGFTKASGRTLATYFKDGQKEVIVVTLNTSNDWETHKQLANQVFEQYDMVQLVEEGSYDLPGDLVVKLEKPIEMLVKDDEDISHVVIINRSNEKKHMGNWNIQVDGKSVISKQVDIERNH